MDEKELRDRIEKIQGNAARRTFEILTAWARANPGRAIALDAAEDGKLQIEFIDRPPNEAAFARFSGETFQDAAAQAAQTIQFNDGHL